MFDMEYIYTTYSLIEPHIFISLSVYDTYRYYNLPSLTENMSPNVVVRIIFLLFFFFPSPYLINHSLEKRLKQENGVDDIFKKVSFISNYQISTFFKTRIFYFLYLCKY